jgi:hypothetical protein
MSFISTQSILNIGDASSSTVNITKAQTIHLGDSSPTQVIYLGQNSNTCQVVVNGIPLPYFKNQFASFTDGSVDGTGTSSSSWYYLPYDAGSFLLVQWGFAPIPTTSTTTINFPVSYDNGVFPYVFATRWRQGGNGPISIVSVDYSKVLIDSSTDSNKTSINWLSIGLKSIAAVP